MPGLAQWTRLSGPVPPQTSGFVQHDDPLFIGGNLSGVLWSDDNGGP